MSVSVLFIFICIVSIQDQCFADPDFAYGSTAGIDLWNVWPFYLWKPKKYDGPMHGKPPKVEVKHKPGQEEDYQKAEEKWAKLIFSGQNVDTNEEFQVLPGDCIPYGRMSTVPSSVGDFKNKINKFFGCYNKQMNRLVHNITTMKNHIVKYKTDENQAVNKFGIEYISKLQRPKYAKVRDQVKVLYNILKYVVTAEENLIQSLEDFIEDITSVNTVMNTMQLKALKAAENAKDIKKEYKEEYYEPLNEYDKLIKYAEKELPRCFDKQGEDHTFKYYTSKQYTRAVLKHLQDLLKKINANANINFNTAEIELNALLEIGEKFEHLIGETMGKREDTKNCLVVLRTNIKTRSSKFSNKFGEIFLY